MQNIEHMKAIFEGLLFIVGEEGVSKEQLKEAMDISYEQIDIIFNELQNYYLNEDRGIELVKYGENYKFLSKSIVHPYVVKLFQSTKQSGLSQAALETLAIIAYKQPITRVEIEEIRGVGSDMMLRKLLARDLIKEHGRSESPGRPILYEVTDEFMDTFKLMSLEELPDLPDFKLENGYEDLFI